MALELIKNVDYWVKRWQHMTLPVLDQTKAALASFVDRAEHLRPQQVSEVALRDPIFALQVLRALNGMPRGRYAAPVVDMNNAVLLLGIRRFIEQFASFPNLDGYFPTSSPIKQKLLAELRRGRLAALIAWEWGKIRLDVRCEELHLAALIHPLQHCMVLCDAELQHAIKQNDAQAVELSDWLCSSESASLLAGLLLKWRFPEHLVDLAVASRQETPRAQCVRLAVRLANALCRVGSQADVERLLAETAEALKADEERLWPLVRSAMLKEARKLPLQGIEPVARHFILLPETAVQPVVPEAESSNETEETRPVRLSPLDEATALLANLPDDVPVNEIFRTLFLALKQKLSLTRIALFVPSTDRSRLHTRHFIGDEAFKMLSIPLGGQHLFARLMGKTQTLWVHGDNGERLLPLLRAEERELLGKGNWFAASLCANQRPLALLIADRGDSARLLDNAHYRCFQHLTSDVARRLSQRAVPA